MQKRRSKEANLDHEPRVDPLSGSIASRRCQASLEALHDDNPAFPLYSPEYSYAVSSILMATYQYQPLRGPRNIRLILLEPSRSFTEPLHCRIFEVSLDQNPQYEAVSYTWGAHATDKTISCINTPLHITTNCEAALRDLRLPREVRALWVDSICIDQSSDAEKSHQIGLMRDVYALAGEVLVWIGKANRSSDLAMASFSSHSRQMLYPSLEYSRDGRFDLQTTGLKLLANAISWCILMVTVKLVTMFCMRVRKCLQPSGHRLPSLTLPSIGKETFSGQPGRNRSDTL